MQQALKTKGTDMFIEEEIVAFYLKAVMVE